MVGRWCRRWVPLAFISSMKCRQEEGEGAVEAHGWQEPGVVPEGGLLEQVKA